MSNAAAGSIVGRGPELAAISAFLQEPPEGACALVLEGEPGIGKTTLWREAIRQATANGHLVLACAPVESETKLSFTALGDLLALVSETVTEALPPPQRKALDVALLRTDPDGSPPDLRAVAVAFVSVLRQLSCTGPVLLAVDDVQWLDPPTSAVLEYAVRRLGAGPVRFVVTLRVQGPRVPTFDGALPNDRRRRERIGPLAWGALHQLIEDRVGCTLLRPTLLSIEKAAAGNPFWALEIARALDTSAEASKGPTLPVPENLYQLVAERVRHLPAETREALLKVSALSHATVDMFGDAPLGPALDADLLWIFEYSFADAGTYAYYCTVHGRTLHAGTIEVT